MEFSEPRPTFNIEMTLHSANDLDVPGTDLIAQAMSSLSQEMTMLRRSSTLYSIISDTETLDSVAIISPNQYISNIVENPGFYIFTSLLWVRKTSQTDEDPSDSRLDEEDSKSRTLDDSKPDLGLLRYHQARLSATARALKWQDIPALEASQTGLNILRSSIFTYLRCLPTLPNDRVERRKLRILLKRNGAITVDSTVIDCYSTTDIDSLIRPFVPHTLDIDSMHQDEASYTHHNHCQIFVDVQPCPPSLFTTHKTSHREHYDSARTRAGIAASPPTKKEVLLYNKNGEVMETSLCTIYFNREGKWITPAAICGGNLGVSRRLALEKGLCKQGTIEVTGVKDGERVWLSNGARGFFIGQICLARPDASSTLQSETSA